MKKTDAVEIVRRIRDKQNKDIEGKSIKEIMEYYKKKASNVFKIEKADLNQD